MPVAAPNGVMDTHDVFGQDVIGFGADDSWCWGPTMLKDGTVAEFMTHPKCS